MQPFNYFLPGLLLAAIANAFPSHSFTLSKKETGTEILTFKRDAPSTSEDLILAAKHEVNTTESELSLLRKRLCSLAIS